MLGDKLDCLISVAQGKKVGLSKTNPHRITWIGIAGWARPPRCRIARNAANVIFAGGWNTVAVRQPTGGFTMVTLPCGPWDSVTPARPRSKERALTRKSKTVSTWPSILIAISNSPVDIPRRLYSGKNELIIGGDKGRIRVNRGGLTGKPAEQLGVAHKMGADEWGSGSAPQNGPRGGQGPQWLQDAIDKLCHGKKPGNHMGNFFECIAEGGMPISDVWSHHRSVSRCPLANIAMLLERRVNWDPKQENFAGDEEANAMIGREQREAYKIDVEV